MPKARLSGMVDCKVIGYVYGIREIHINKRNLYSVAASKLHQVHNEVHQSLIKQNSTESLLLLFLIFGPLHHGRCNTRSEGVGRKAAREIIRLRLCIISKPRAQLIMTKLSSCFRTVMCAGVCLHLIEGFHFQTPTIGVCLLGIIVGGAH